MTRERLRRNLERLPEASGTSGIRREGDVVVYVGREQTRPMGDYLSVYEQQYCQPDGSKSKSIAVWGLTWAKWDAIR